MLHCSAVMKVTNERRKASFHFIHIILSKNFNENHFHHNGTNVSIKVLIISESKSKVFIGFDTLFLTNFCGFSERGLPVYALITQ